MRQASANPGIPSIVVTLRYAKGDKDARNIGRVMRRMSNGRGVEIALLGTNQLMLSGSDIQELERVIEQFPWQRYGVREHRLDRRMPRIPSIGSTPALSVVPSGYVPVAEAQALVRETEKTYEALLREHNSGSQVRIDTLRGELTAVQRTLEDALRESERHRGEHTEQLANLEQERDHLAEKLSVELERYNALALALREGGIKVHEREGMLRVYLPSLLAIIERAKGSKGGSDDRGSMAVVYRELVEVLREGGVPFQDGPEGSKIADKKILAAMLRNARAYKSDIRERDGEINHLKGQLEGEVSSREAALDRAGVILANTQQELDRVRQTADACEAAAVVYTDLVAVVEAEKIPVIRRGDGLLIPDMEVLRRRVRGAPEHLKTIDRLREEVRAHAAELAALEHALGSGVNILRGEYETVTARIAVLEARDNVQGLTWEDLLAESVKQRYAATFERSARAFQERFPEGITGQIQTAATPLLAYVIQSLEETALENTGVNLSLIADIDSLRKALQDQQVAFEHSPEGVDLQREYRLAEAYVRMHGPLRKSRGESGENQLYTEQLAIVEDYESRKREWVRRAAEAGALSSRLEEVVREHAEAVSVIGEIDRSSPIRIGCYVYGTSEEITYRLSFLFPTTKETKEYSAAFWTKMGLAEALRQRGDRLDLKTVRGVERVDIIYDTRRPQHTKILEIVQDTARFMNTQTLFAHLGMNVEMTYFNEENADHGQ